MSVLQTLKLAVKPVFQPTAEYTRRQKLIVRLQEQQRLAEATIAGKSYHRMRWVLGADEDGEPERQQRSVRIRQWWSKDAAGTVLMTVRYGRKMVELSKGLNAIHVGDISALPAVINQLIKAVEGCELDAQLSAIAADNPFPKRIKPVAKTANKRN
jgi:hypothetical protein